MSILFLFALFGMSITKMGVLLKGAHKGEAEKTRRRIDYPDKADEVIAEEPKNIFD